MSDQDQLERDVEAALARLTTDAVPDTRRPPAPPWQQRRRTADVRRFGRATPWLVAAVLLVLAGLGISTAVAFDAGGPEHGPAVTEHPSPSATTTAPDGTLGTAPVPTPTPTSHPTLSRLPNVAAPDDGVSTGASTPTGGSYVVGIGSYGAYRAGMTQAQAEAVLGQPFDSGGGVCMIHLDHLTDFALTALNGVVVGIVAPKTAEDSFGNGVGTTLTRLESSYPSGTLAESSSGWVFSVTDGGDGLGFLFAASPPGGSDTVAYIFTGTADYARGYELCSG